MAYYSMYYMVLALLFATGIKCENHSGAIILLERLYGIDNHRIEPLPKGTASINNTI